MPEAIATTKRKFYKALDSLTNNSTATTHDSQSLTTNNKRTSAAAAAFDEARERARKRLRQSTSTTSLANNEGSPSVISLPRPTSVKLRPKSGIESRAPPNFSPWSQESFLARLKTYSSVSTWYPKSDPISEVEWAKRGWVCIDVNTVACRGGCERRVVVSLETTRRKLGQKTEGHGSRDESQKEDDDDDDDEAEAAALEEALAERYKDEIVDGHSSSCMWHKAGCKDDIYRLPVVRPSIWQPELSKRFRSLLSIGSSIDKVKTKPLESTSTPEKLLKDLPREVIDPSDTTYESSAKALEIALHGWRGTSESGNDLLHCDACFQRVGLWMYQPEYLAARRRPSVNDEDEEEDEDEVGVDLVEMHREHCPWRNPTSQKATGSLAGLNAAQILQRVVATAARDHRRRSHEPVLAVGGDDDQHVAEETTEVSRTLTRAEVAQQDKERESRMRKLKNLFNIKRKSTSVLPARNAA
ncbi:Putative Zinc finger, C3HC, nuclear-interacting partner of ALK/Rsm1 [Septoria linicola]|uniref:Zinc finger, C3HC, nuclear-interacting partner of ALK/Rsm1 n=1 Tax=Septoria linicola TaxID=215465 RepID=A0A9Q9AP31_9PEZI|nr:Putative Zinc finger, C3HC, nuclear-interacting partner of ALK/Rsm1 [Septoria linicola]